MKKLLEEQSAGLRYSSPLWDQKLFKIALENLLLLQLHKKIVQKPSRWPLNQIRLQNFLTPLCHTIHASLHFPSSRFNCCRVSQICTFWHFLWGFFHKYWSWVLHAGDQVTNCWNSIDHGLHFDLTSHYHCTALHSSASYFVTPLFLVDMGGFHKWR